MSDDSTTQCLLFPGIFRKPIVAQFDQREGSSDGGALLLKSADGRYGLLDELTACLRDPRQAGKVDHGLRELLAQRVFSIACGYPDANDCARLASDPIHKLLLDRDPVEGRDLASQPTLSRFENGVGVKELYRMGEALALSVIRRHGKRLRRRAYRVTIDLDPTDDPTHGAQQLSFFNGHYDNWCYLPVLGFVSFNEEAEQYLCAAVLRPGNVTAAVGAVGLLRRLVRIIRNRFPGVQIRVRLDGGFAHPAVLEFLDAQPKLEYVVAMAKNAVLKRVAAPGIRRARQLSRSSGKTEHIYGEVRYAARKWPALRRVVIKAEVVRAPEKDPKPPLCHHQYETEPAVDLRTGLLPARRHRESHKGAARSRDGPHQLYQLLGEPVSCPAHCSGLRSDAGAAFARCRYSLRPGPGGHASRAAAQAWCSSVGFGTTHCRSSARVVSVSTGLPTSRSGTGRCHWMT